MPPTTQVEPPIPYPLAVRVLNYGYGIANKLRIDSAQPKIVDNKQGLLVDFRILGPVEAGSCRPFDARRAGTVLGEGAGVLILESADHARRRGAPLRSRITGFGLTTENFSLTGPDPSGAGVVGAAEKALAGLSRPPGWIKTHGTGTVVNDAAECAGLARLFGSELETIPLTSLKSTLGHCLGASGAVEAVASVLCMEEGIVPATVGTTSPDRSLPPCRVATEVESVSEGSVLLLAESFGGRCAAMVLEPSAWGS